MTGLSAERPWEIVLAALSELGAGPGEVVRTRMYVVDASVAVGGALPQNRTERTRASPRSATAHRAYTLRVAPTPPPGRKPKADQKPSSDLAFSWCFLFSRFEIR